MRCPTAVFISWVMALVPGSAALSPPTAPTPPPDWRIELVAEAPAVRHPSVVCSAPDGRVFVAEDPMDISAPANAMHGRILCLHPGGKRTIFATNLYAVFGMQYLEGKLYVLHNPKFSVFEDGNGIGANRIDLIESTHPNPWALDWNDHVPANFKLAMDGYFYMAVGDKGIYGAVGRDGKRVDLKGGGILRLRPDGTSLEVFCTGVRNILDVALNAEDEIFTYDNTDEHNWMGRLTHMVEGGFYGYPHDFVPRRPYTLWMMADFGAGAATGAFAYTEDALPPEYHDNLFLADFGKRQILRVKVAREGATYRVLSKEELFRDPPEDFRPVGIAPSADGTSIYVCDWAHRDTKENVEVGRLWKLTYTGRSHAATKPAWYRASTLGQKSVPANTELLDALRHPAKTVRLAAQRELGRRVQDVDVLQTRLLTIATNRTESAPTRWHALWALASVTNKLREPEAEAFGKLATADPEPSVRRQTLRVLAERRSATGIQAARNALNDRDASVRFAAATAFRRLGTPKDIPLLVQKAGESDPFTRYAIFTAINHLARNGSDPPAWDIIVAGLSDSSGTVRETAVFALRNTYNADLVSRLASLARDASRPIEAREASLRILAEVHYAEAPWKGEWWAYHPALQPPPKKTIQWSETARITELLRELISDSATPMRLLALEGITAANDRIGFSSAIRRYNSEPEANVRNAIVENSRHFKDDATFTFLQTVIANADEQPDILRNAISSVAALGRAEAARSLSDLLRRPGITPQLKTACIEALGNLKSTDSVPLIAAELESQDESCRLAAVRALGEIGGDDASARLRKLLEAEPVSTRLETIKALGTFRDTNAVPELVDAWRSAETQHAALEALARIADPRALEVYLAGLQSANPATRELCRKALDSFRDAALPQIQKLRSHLTGVALAELREVYKDRPDARELFDEIQAPSLADYESHALQRRGNAVEGAKLFFDEHGVACSKCHLVAGRGKAVGPDLSAVGKQFSRRELIEHILHPSRAVREGYAQTVIETVDGDTISGLVRTETADSVLLLDGGGQLRDLPKSSIAKRSASSFSLMPEGLHAGLSVEAFADLIVYLESLKGSATP